MVMGEGVGGCGAGVCPCRSFLYFHESRLGDAGGGVRDCTGRRGVGAWYQARLTGGIWLGGRQMGEDVSDDIDVL